MIYFIRIQDGGPIKIGVTEDPRSRLAALQGSHAQKLELWRLFEGGYLEEQALHKRFKSSRIEREWFICHPDMEGDLGLREILQRDFPKKVKRPSRKSQVVAIRMPNELKASLDAAATETGKTVAAIGLDLYRSYVERREMSAPERLSHG